jgi:hypothetical protein
MNKTLLAAALGAAVALPAAPAAASSKAPTPSPTYEPSYCIPPNSPQQAAQGAVTATTAVLSPYTPAGLAAVHGLSVTVGAPGAGRLSVTIAARARHGQAIVGRGSESVKAAGCRQLSIRLTPAGRKLLKHAKTITLKVTGAFDPKRGHSATAKGSVTLS